jgi:hypothetical protein
MAADQSRYTFPQADRAAVVHFDMLSLRKKVGKSRW